MFELIIFGLVIWSLVYCVKKKGLVGFLLWFLLPGLGILIVMALPRERERERAKKKKKFWCGVCHYTYKEDLLANEDSMYGKVCRFCWEKKLKEKGDEWQKNN